MQSKNWLKHGLMGVAVLVFSSSAFAYDGTNCKEPGNCWEPKPGFPEKIAGSKYDPKHDPVELSKQEKAIKAMNERNAKRVANLKETGQFKYDVK
ncbi:MULTISPECIES: methanol dehydrogenase [cytochrome c] subunit [Methylovorus]|jgi:methanol dehydrogenase (cytochrome c) subunit 2|uniref:methanol dehydrogenase [cytochrome c] subunit n=1 Tax=Methylovorus TaxID=81682 RepID=UPI0001EC44DD|nr:MULTISPECIES: methanol dehydrogenase [cytochrome c] subunit [Methylovorus]ADQ83946.1 Alcohol dehydrogenase (acceptor) [Methylovorus sp. MP688]KAF0844671.1 methanol dehydrogenase (cytochrome) small subunit [Methylovorus glucosotrophus]